MDDPLAVYLHDHLAGSSFAVELLEKLASEFTGTASGEVAHELLEQVQIDRKSLEQLIAKVGKENSDLYDAPAGLPNASAGSNLNTMTQLASGPLKRLRLSASASSANVLSGKLWEYGRNPTLGSQG